MNETLAAPSAAPRPAGLPRPVPAAAAPHPLGFALFLLVNFVLFVRPTDFVPGLVGLELYLYVMLACLAVSFPVVFEQLRPSRLEAEPLTVCMFGMGLAVVLSLLMTLRLADAAQNGFDFAKMIPYVLLLRGLVTTPRRLRAFLLWLGAFVAVSATVSLLDFHGVVALPMTTRLIDGGVARLRGTGIFLDPNDLCVLVAVGVQVGLYGLTDSHGGLPRLLWLPALVVMGLALVETQSRGGLLAVLAGLALTVRARFGWRRGLLLAAIGLPLLVLVVSARQADLSTTTETGQDRVQLWSDALMQFRQSPLVGVGADQLGQRIGQVAHNSYLQAFAELGLLGGVCFTGAFLFALFNLYRLCPDVRRLADPEMRRLQPFVLGALTSWMVGMASLTLTYLLPTFMVLGLAAVVLRQGRAEPPLPQPRFNLRFAGWLLAASVVFLAGLYVFVRLTVIR